MWIILFIVTVFFGYLLISFWQRDFSLIEKLLIGFSLGLGIVSLLMFLIGLVGFPLTSTSVLALILLLCFILLLSLKIKSKRLILFERPVFKRLSFLEILLICFILLFVFWSFSQTIFWPPWEWDSLALYDFRGRVIAENHSLATDFFTSQPNLTAYNYVYPFSTSLMHTLIYLGGGSNPQFIYSLYYASLLGLLYVCLRKRISRLQSLAVVAVLASTPEILFPSTIAYPNIPYALYFSFSTIYFWEWMIHKKNGFFFVSAIFLGLSAWIRNSEPFWVVNLAIILLLLFSQRKFALSLIYLSIFLPIKQIWPLYQKHIFANAGEIALSPPSPFGFDLSKIPEVVSFVLRYFIHDWLGYLFILFISMLLFWKVTGRYKYLVFWLFGYLLLAIAGTYFFSVSFPWWNQIGGSASRISVFFAPLILYVATIFWINLSNLKSKKEAAGSLFLKIATKKFLIIKWSQIHSYRK